MGSREAVLIIGAGSGLGAALARQCANAGFDVVLHANSKIQDAHHEAKSLVALGVNVSVVSGNLLEEAEVTTLIPHATKAIGKPITHLINNASIFESDTAQDFTHDNWDRHFDIHLCAPRELAHNLALALPEGQKGSVINIIDQCVFKLTPHNFNYTLPKAAFATATKTLAQALAPNVRVNGVASGPTARNIRQSEGDFQKQVDATLLGTGSPYSEICETVLWLLGANAVTGQVIAVDGGQSLIWQTPDVMGIVE